MPELKKLQTLAILPARFNSTRFPGKPLVDILGKSLIQRTYDQVRACQNVDHLIVATDDRRIAEHVKAFGGDVALTSPDCPTGTDRLVDALSKRHDLNDYSIIVNVQGDEPLIEPSTIDAVISLLEQDPALPSASAAALIDDIKDIHDPSIVKCVFGLNGDALYFSRSPIPYASKEATFYRHVGIYGFQRDFLLKYAQLPLSPLQLQEDLEQLKILEYGYRLRLKIVIDSGIGVNTPQDLMKVKDWLCRQNTSSSQEA
ncbi:MAG: 3-deoxy-manno-octulosonate cytidylyltransferase [Chlamydiales bacterium]|jgi:3-deoxy-manno-octulosonate cytidylyltransferase (CMP-KDO synthetase)|nr:3-deoxy-manno-octulosonate cytidylyltransferase [Chlamydiales bacterium]